jgi:uncharacterized protein YdiU (UPF0061 family)
MSAPQPYRPDVAILDLGDEFYDIVEPASFPELIPRFLNRHWADRVGLGELDDAAWAAHFGRFEPLPENLQQPLALRYHGHQFRQYNPEIGDGRGFLFGQLRDERDRLLDFGTKGTGTTPWSRRGDGRLTLKGGVREVLATEMLEALGVNTSKTFALFETGEALYRGDEPSPTRSSVLTRLSHGHIRIGSFQRLAFFEDTANIAKLTRYSLAKLFGESPAEDDAANAARLFDLVATRTAGLAASYMAAGFVHGVLNSDNINVTGESFDYGPWRFTPEWDPSFTAAYFDDFGLYSFGRQPEAIHWDLAQFAGCLALIGEARPLSDTLADWVVRYETALIEALLARLGVAPRSPAEDRPLAAQLIEALQSREVGIDRLFFDWRCGRDPGGETYTSKSFRALAARLEGRVRPRAHAYWSDPAPCSMHIEEVEAIWAAIDQNDDWSLFEAKVAAIRRMGEAMRADA